MIIKDKEYTVEYIVQNRGPLDKVCAIKVNGDVQQVVPMDSNHDLADANYIRLPKEGETATELAAHLLYESINRLLYQKCALEDKNKKLQKKCIELKEAADLWFSRYDKAKSNNSNTDIRHDIIEGQRRDMEKLQKENKRLREKNLALKE